jgi:hypothetical protein
MQPWPRQAAPPHLIHKTQRPVRVVESATDQAVSGPFLRAYGGSGLLIHCLARVQLTPKRAKVARIVSPVTNAGVSHWPKLTLAASSRVQRLVGFSKQRGL